VVVGDYCPVRPSMDHMAEALARPSCGQEGDQEAVGSLSSLMMILEGGRMEVDILPHVVAISYPTVKMEGHQEAADIKMAARHVPVFGL
jgi:hypothetical protein